MLGTAKEHQQADHCLCSLCHAAAAHSIHAPPQTHNSYRSNNEELFSFSVSDNLIAAGGQGNVLFWDRRTQQLLAAFDDMHMDDVTQVRVLGAVTASGPAPSTALC